MVAQTKPITARFELNTDHGGSTEQGMAAPWSSNHKSSLELPTTTRIASTTHPDRNSALVDREQQRGTSVDVDGDGGNGKLDVRWLLWMDDPMNKAYRDKATWRRWSNNLRGQRLTV